MSARISALKALTSKPPNQADLDAVIAEFVHSGQARATILLGAALLQEALGNAIRRLMQPGIGSTYDALLFENDGPLSGFSRVIRVAYGFGIVDKEIEKELQYIRELRNCFAHSQMSLSFETAEVKDVCELFKTHYTDVTDLGVAPDHPRAKFIGSVTAIFRTLGKTAANPNPLYPVGF